MAGQSNTHIHLGNVYLQQKDFDRARKEFELCIDIAKQTGDKGAMASALSSVAIIYSEQEDIVNALKYAMQSLTFAKETNIAEIQRTCYEILYVVYKKKGQYELSLDMYEAFIKLRDSLNNSEAQRELVRQEFKYKYEKKAGADSVRIAQEKKVTEAQLQQEQTQRYALYGGLGLTFIFGLFMFNRFRITYKQKNIIMEQKQLVELQKHIVEEKQREVMDSIHYAKRIQEAILTSERYIDKNMKRIKG
jgi:tetratricopeptide (TPR) repeat protein